MNRLAEQPTEWVIASEAFAEQNKRADQRLQAFLGTTAIRGDAVLELSECSSNESTLLSAAQLAPFGDESALKMVHTNAATCNGERMFKIGQSKVELEFNGGQLMQDGRVVTDIHRNTFEHTVLIPEMRQRSQYELKAPILFEELYANGVLDTHDAVLFSPASTKMTTEEKRDYRFFLDTESCSIQMLSATGNKATLETAFVAGKATPTSERHDLQTIQKVLQAKGHNININDGTKALRYIVLIPKSQAPNGVVDIVKLYDEAAGGTFYGEAKPQQDYLVYAAKCEARSTNFKQLTDEVAAQLINEAHLLTTPLEAIMRLDEISERLCVKYSVKHQEINAQVFGTVSAGWIDLARQAALSGDNHGAEQLLIKAQNTAESGSCPLYKPVSGDPSDTQNPSSEKTGKKAMNCPFCKAKVFDDPCKAVLSCWDCKAMVVNGRVQSKGDGGSQARTAKQADERKNAQKRQLAELAKQVNEVFEAGELSEATIAIGAVQKAQPKLDLVGV